MSGQYTPGPWTAGERAWPEQIGCCPLVGRPFSVHAADHMNVAAATTVANARLIAAAPDMLTALVDLERYLRETPHHNAMQAAAARAAIAKAIGK